MPASACFPEELQCQVSCPLMLFQAPQLHTPLQCLQMVFIICKQKMHLSLH